MDTNETLGMTDDEYRAWLKDREAEEAPGLRAEVATLTAERDALRAEVRRYAKREEHFARVLSVADGGQYRNDWNAAIERVVRERDEARAETRRVHARWINDTIAFQRLAARAVSGVLREARLYMAIARALLCKERDVPWRETPKALRRLRRKALAGSPELLAWVEARRVTYVFRWRCDTCGALGDAVMRDDGVVDIPEGWAEVGVVEHACAACIAKQHAQSAKEST